MTHKDYQNFEIEELVRDPYFRHSVLTPDEQAMRFWSGWRALSPLNEEKYEQARLTLIALQEAYSETLSETEVLRRLNRIRKMDPEDRKRSDAGSLNKWWWGAAAAVVVAAAGLWWGYSEKPGHAGETTLSGTVIQNDDYAATPASGEILKENNTASNLTLMLSDSSVVTLLPGSRLKFPSVFGAEDRKVALSGDAFFDVTSNPGRPFIVYAGDAVVKVLGTSFRVTAFESDGRVTVKVLSGRVSVYTLSDFPGTVKSPGTTKEGVLLVPNEEVVMDAATRKIEKSVIASPQEESGKARFRELIFDDVPISQIFTELERIYGMEIEFDQDTFRQCPITTYFRDESLLERINTICQAVGATYRPENGKIIVSGIDCTGYEK